MDHDTQEHDGGNSSRFHTVQPLRDLESNWAVDLAKNLEDYLLKICSGELTASDEDAHFSVNFAEAALLLQGSIQVYSRKVEYLYNLVLHALEYISQTRSQDHVDSTSAQKEASSCHAVEDEDDQFWVSDDIPVEGKNGLDNVTSKDNMDNFLKPPANLVVLEGDCLDSTGDGGELESYLLATNDLYRDFVLLDQCDSSVVDEFLKGEKSGDVQYGRSQGNSLISKAHQSFLSPARRSGGTAHKLSSKKGLNNFGQGSPLGTADENLDNGFGPGPSHFSSPYHDNHGFESDDNHSHHGDFEDPGGDDDDPWKLLNPHEPGNLQVRPFKKVKVRRAAIIKQSSIGSQFPLAKLHGITCSELTEIWEMRFRALKSQSEPQPPSLYEKLQGCLVDERVNHDSFCPPETDTKDTLDQEINDFDQDDFDMPDTTTFMDEQHLHFDDNHLPDIACGIEDPYPQENLEDLCRAHLDALLASISENEKQTELAARVSTWKQRIETDLEEEDSRPPFDIHLYGEMVLDKLSFDEEGSDISFTDVVKGQEKHDIARTFSALLQLVNERKVDLDRGTSVDEPFCYTDANPFHVRLLSNTRGPRKMQFEVAKKRPVSPITKKRTKRTASNQSLGSSPSPASSESPGVLSKPTCKLSAKMNANGRKTTPDGKRRRRSRLAESDDLKSGR